MSAPSAARPRQEDAAAHAEFLALAPVIERHARVVFRHRKPVDREEAIAESVAAAFESYVALKARGKDPVRDFPSMMATFAVLHVKDGRHVGGRSSSQDVLSRKAQGRHRFRVESLPASLRNSHDGLYSAVGGQEQQDVFEERLHDNTRTPVPDQVCFRLDWPAFLQTLTQRDRGLAGFLAMGHSAKAAAEQFNLSPGRVTQLRQRWRREWLTFQGETSSYAGACGSNGTAQRHVHEPALSR
jgi:hypothetical protein